MNGSNEKYLCIFRGATRIRKLNDNLYLGKYLLQNLLYNVATSTNSDIMKRGSGSSKTYLKSEHIKYLHDMQKLTHGPKVIVSNNETIHATIKSNLNLHLVLKH